jgi:nuclear pore complex protein Nup107
VRPNILLELALTLGSSSRSQTLSEVTTGNAFLSPTAQARSSVNSNRDLLDLLTIRDWLHSIAPDIHPAEIRRNYLPYTKNALKSHLRAGKRPPRHVPTSLDPDATFRLGGTQLETEDEAYETALLRTLFEYVRIGELATAVDMCRQSDQSWRAASLSGGNLFRDAVLDADDADMDQDGQLNQGGNLNRRLWKLTCQKMASSVSGRTDSLVLSSSHFTALGVEI